QEKPTLIFAGMPLSDPRARAARCDHLIRERRIGSSPQGARLTDCRATIMTTATGPTKSRFFLSRLASAAALMPPGHRRFFELAHRLGLNIYRCQIRLCDLSHTFRSSK